MLSFPGEFLINVLIVENNYDNQVAYPLTSDCYWAELD